MICVMDLLESCSRTRIVIVFIRMVSQCQLPVSFPDFLVAGICIDSKCAVEIFRPHDASLYEVATFKKTVVAKIKVLKSLRAPQRPHCTKNRSLTYVVPPVTSSFSSPPRL